MKRTAFKMKLKAGMTAEYKIRHQNIWPELKSLLKESGISDYSIWLDEETNVLFATQKVSDAYQENRLINEPVMRRWWEYMADLMETNEDYSPVVVELKEMFFLE